MDAGEGRKGQDVTQGLGVQTVLVVDEDPLVRQAFRALLTRDGYRSLQAESLSQAMALVRDEAVDLVITDLEFGGRAAPEAPARIRQIRDLPVIAVGADPAVWRSVAARSGAVFLKKPADIGAIRAAIAACLPNRTEE